MCAEFGAVTVSEMTYVKGILYRDPKSLRRITRAETEEKYGIQLLTNSPEDLVRTIEIIESNNLSDFIELNLGCPKPKITNAGLGASLLTTKNHTLLRELMEVGCSSSKLPFSIKMRAGFDELTFPEVVKIAEKAGVSFITFHSRLATDNYLVPAKGEYWKQALNDSTIPIIANGDIRSYDQAMEVITQFGVKGVAIGRAVRGNPQIFQKKTTLSSRDIYARLVKYMENTEYFNLFNIRVQSADFMKHFRYSARARKKILTMTNLNDIVEYTLEMLRKR
jgi:tRNA-dihydrouridine synthase